MRPIGSTSSNIRRAVAFIAAPSLAGPCSTRTLTITWTTARRRTHRVRQRLVSWCRSNASAEDRQPSLVRQPVESFLHHRRHVLVDLVDVWMRTEACLQVDRRQYLRRDLRGER